MQDHTWETEEGHYNNDETMCDYLDLLYSMGAMLK
jgi:hypothetical protein